MTAKALPVASTPSSHVVETPALDSLTDFEPRTLTLSPAGPAQSGPAGLKVGDGGESPGEGLP
jgi:hypothetical protein